VKSGIRTGAKDRREFFISGYNTELISTGVLYRRKWIESCLVIPAFIWFLFLGINSNVYILGERKLWVGGGIKISRRWAKITEQILKDNVPRPGVPRSLSRVFAGVKNGKV
jgi:hypothetical protein